MSTAQPAPKKSAVPVVRTPAQIKAAEKRAEQAKISQQAQNLAQIVNLHIAGYSLADIGAQIGATADEVDSLLSNEAMRYVRNQPALRTYVRNYISGKFADLLEGVWDKAVDRGASDQLEHVDRAERILTKMARLHGAEAPTQTEIKVESAPDEVNRLVEALSKAQGVGYDTDVFDVEYTETVIDDVVESAHEAEQVSRNQVEESDGHDEL